MRRFFNNSFGNYQGGYDEGFDGDDNMGGGGFDEDNFPWDSNADPPPGPMPKNNFRRPRYNDAYGDYRGGYGPGGGFGPRPLMHGPPPRMPPPLMLPMRPMRLGPPGPPRGAMWGRGFGPGGPSRRHINDDKAIKYLMRCGVTKEHLKNLPHDLLLLIQPEYCGLCDFSLDSFATSRMHYISKNHIKNQKKWLAKTQGVVPSKEIPFKSRDLYCELCDIQITSKMHGDAHYDGKPHRGIVEGRKKPKNPLLLQANMQHRLDQLIRREKRCLKPAKETTATGEEGAEPVAPPKITSPELYCEICKTTVTCSEQMTMHLNGKKHLSKEKQHILGMMRGKTEDKNEDDEENGDEDGEEETQEDGNGDAEPAEENKAAADDDWGNEAWENQDQTAAKA